jgi:hypothetical protein
LYGASGLVPRPICADVSVVGELPHGPGGGGREGLSAAAWATRGFGSRNIVVSVSVGRAWLAATTARTLGDRSCARCSTAVGGQLPLFTAYRRMSASLSSVNAARMSGGVLGFRATRLRSHRSSSWLYRRRMLGGVLELPAISHCIAPLLWVWLSWSRMVHDSWCCG